MYFTPYAKNLDGCVSLARIRRCQQATVITLIDNLKLDIQSLNLSHLNGLQKCSIVEGKLGVNPADRFVGHLWERSESTASGVLECHLRHAKLIN